MVDQGRLSAGETALVHAVGSGVGTAAVQLARAIGAQVLGTARTAAKLERAREFGLQQGVVVEQSTFAEAVLARTAGRGVDVVLELVGGPYVAEDLRCVASRGRIVVVGAMAGAESQISLALLMRKRLELRGTVLRARPLEEKILAALALERHVVPLLASGAVRPVVDRVLPLAQAAEAHKLMHANTTFGKVVLEV